MTPSDAPRKHRRRYFQTPPGAPPPVTACVKRRIQFSDVDPMAVLWHGRYANLFEQANEELGRRCGMTYEAFRLAGLRTPIVQLHVDYFAPILLGEEVAVTARMIWNDAARMNLEYEVKKENSLVAATGYTVQMFVSEQLEPLLACPKLQLDCQQRWRDGEFHREENR